MAGVGQTFAQYRIERELHRGPSAVSYVAVDTILERRVLLKVLEPEGHSTEQLEQFRVEALAYARLQHPNIVTLYQFDTWQGHTFLVLEFVDGKSLSELIRDFGPLPSDVALTISRDLFRGLAYAHERGVLHRDLKPSNVLVANDGWTKVADFGLAALGERGDAPKPGVTGTLAYMAPEVLRGEGATERSDLYSAGATLYEMLAGRRLFQSEEVTSCAEAVLNGRWQPLKVLRPEIPESVAELVHGLLALSPGDRPTSAAAVVERLNQIAAEDSVTLRAEVVRRFLAEPPPARAKPKPGQTMRRATKFSSAVLGALLVLVVLAAALGWLWHSRVDLPGNLQVVSRPAAPSTEVSRRRGTQPGSRQGEQVKAKPAGDARKTKSTPQHQGAARSESAPQAPTASGQNTAAAVPAAVQPTGDAWLFVRCTPWAEVELDGAVVGVVPQLGSVRATPGSHLVVLRHPDFPPCSLKVVLKPAQRETLTVNLWERIAQLWLQVAPWAEVWVDGKLVDTTPLDRGLILAPGEHEIELRNPAFNPWRKTLRLRAGTKVTLRVSLATGYWELVQ